MFAIRLVVEVTEQEVGLIILFEEVHMFYSVKCVCVTPTLKRNEIDNFIEKNLFFMRFFLRWFYYTYTYLKVY